MAANNLDTAIDATGIAHKDADRWTPDKPPAPPYILYFPTGTANFAADNVVYMPITNYDIELYSNERDPASEALIEAALTNAGIFYDKVYDWIQSEELHRVIYSVTI